MALPSFLFRANEFSLGQHVDSTTLDLLYSRSSSKLETYELKKKPKYIGPSWFEYSLELVHPDTAVDDLSRLLKVPKSYIFQRYISGDLDFLLKHLLDKPAVVVNFELCTKYKSIIPNKKDHMIRRVDYGFQFFAVLQLLKGETDQYFKKCVKEALSALFKKNFVNYTNGSCVLVFPHDHDYSIQPFVNFFGIVETCMKNSRNYQPINFYLNVELQLNDDRNFDQLWKDALCCKGWAESLRISVPVTAGYSKITSVTVNGIDKLQTEISKSCHFPLAELNMVLEYCRLVQDSFTTYRNDIFEVINALKNLLNCAIKVAESFIPLNDYWFLKCSDEILKNAPAGTRFFISNGNNNTTYYDIFVKEKWIFATFDHPNAPDDDLFYTTDGNNRSKGYGIAYSKASDSLPSSPSSRLYVHPCPCGISQCSNYWICDKCHSFFFYHQKRPQYVSCKCYSVEISTLMFKSLQKKCINHDIIEYVPFMCGKPKSDHTFWNVLIMGPSGAGKSTLVNGIANYLKYETLAIAEADNDVSVVIPCEFGVQDDDYNTHTVKMGNADEAEENFNSLGHSVTQKPKDYYFPIGGGEYIHIIDTPGLADSRGVEQDNRNLELIRHAIINVGSLNAICFVLKPNEAKLTIGLESTMRQLLSIFPKKALESVLFLFTNSRGSFYRPGDSIAPITKLINDLKEECGANLDFGKNNVFCTDNEGFRFLCARACNINYTTATHRDYEDSWKHSRDATIALINRIRNEKPFDTQTINFYTELAAIAKKWAEWISRGCKMTSDRCKRYGTIATELEKNLIGIDCRDLVQLAKSKNFKNALPVSDLMGLMIFLHEEFVEPDLDTNLANEMRAFIDKYIFQF